MAIAEDDWRRAGQEAYLQGAPMTLKCYQALSVEWEHEHCEFCWRTFLDANFSPRAREAVAKDPERNALQGWTTAEVDGWPAGRWWVCEECFADFRDEFGWTIVETDPRAWPYAGPEPSPRPRAQGKVRFDGLLRRPE